MYQSKHLYPIPLFGDNVGGGDSGVCWAESTQATRVHIMFMEGPHGRQIIEQTCSLPPDFCFAKYVALFSSNLGSFTYACNVVINDAGACTPKISRKCH